MVGEVVMVSMTVGAALMVMEEGVLLVLDVEGVNVVV